jgi:multimeric flavodoxin WrbA
MKVMAFNGSPRKEGWNTVTLLNHALQGAKSVGADTELVQLYDLNFSGCISCFACKRLDRKEDGVCVVQDDLAAVLDRIKNADALIIGSPVYFGTETASTRAFFERLCFPYLKYAKDMRSLFPRRIQTAMIYAMNVSEKDAEAWGFARHFLFTKMMLEFNFGACELMLCEDTMQFSDYNKFESAMFDKEAKVRRHAEIFPEDCKRAFDLGVRMASGKLP